MPVQQKDSSSLPVQSWQAFCRWDIFLPARFIMPPADAAACTTSVAAGFRCEDLTNCGSCLQYASNGRSSDGCLWCVAGSPTPRCITDSPGRKAQGCTAWYGAGPQECPRCESITNCGSCLQYATNGRGGGCQWCVSGTPTPRCVTEGQGGCNAWFGSGPQECPARG